jgi:hypothetical protein
MTRICRAAGIPSRVAVGFITDPDANALGFTPVRSDQAHAWVEVWFDRYGWITFDPTSQTMAPGEEYPVKFISPDKWLSLVEEILNRSGEVTVAQTSGNSPDRNVTWWNRILSAAKQSPVFLWLIFSAVIFLIYLPFRIIPYISGLIQVIHSGKRIKTVAAWRAAASYLVRTGFSVNKGETALAWAKRLEYRLGTSFKKWSGLYLKAVFAKDFSDEDFQKSRQLRDTALKDIRNSLSCREKIKGLIAPGWFRRIPWK